MGALTRPAATKADDNEVNGITSALASLEMTRVVDENPTSLNDYGLSNPRIEVDFKAAGDKDYRKLLIGEKTPTGGGLFAMLAAALVLFGIINASALAGGSWRGAARR